MLKELFQKRKYTAIAITKENINSSNPSEENKSIQWDEIIGDNYTKCKACSNILEKKKLRNNLNVCPVCGFHNRMGALERLGMIVDKNTFIEYDSGLSTLNPLEYSGYEDKIKEATEISNINEAVLTGEGLINGHKVAIGIMDSTFIMGSMGSVVGEKLARLTERAIESNIPVVIFSTSGGARMQEGILSLMQMAKVSAALKKLADSKQLYISMLTDPTTGGVTASFAMLGDVILAEPGAQIGFAGKRVIEQTIKQKLPHKFQTSEFLMEHGFVDRIVKRHDLKNMISKIIMLHS